MKKMQHQKQSIYIYIYIINSFNGLFLAFIWVTLLFTVGDHWTNVNKWSNESKYQTKFSALLSREREREREKKTKTKIIILNNSLKKEVMGTLINKKIEKEK